MFTGIVQRLSEVVAIEPEGSLVRLKLDLGEHAAGLELGASVAVNGTCLTVTNTRDTNVSFDVIRETLDITNLGKLTVGDRVNTERSYRVGDEVGGHVLSGHVCSTVEVVDISEDEGRRDITFSVEPQWSKYLQHKGFVALDGASLTLARVDREASTLTVCLIPETISRTTLGTVVPGDRVNLELDNQTQSIVDTVERVLAERGLIG
ncbi:MAG: riboflavin synthase subunit alpha [Granulosicoccaceae bacterium]